MRQEDESLTDDPPSTKKAGESVQHDGANRLPHGTVHGNDAWRRELAYVLVAPGSKPYSWMLDR